MFTRVRCNLHLVSWHRAGDVVLVIIFNSLWDCHALALPEAGFLEGVWGVGSERCSEVCPRNNNFLRVLFVRRAWCRGDSGWLLLAEGDGRAAGQLEKCQ